MRSVVFTCTLLLLSSWAGAHEPGYADGPYSSYHIRSRRSGSTSVSSQRQGMTMNDRDKMWEMCRSLKTDEGCEAIVQDCADAMNREACVQSHRR